VLGPFRVPGFAPESFPETAHDPGVLISRMYVGFSGGLSGVGNALDVLGQVPPVVSQFHELCLE